MGADERREFDRRNSDREFERWKAEIERWRGHLDATVGQLTAVVDEVRKDHGDFRVALSRVEQNVSGLRSVVEEAADAIEDNRKATVAELQESIRKGQEDIAAERLSREQKRVAYLAPLAASLVAGIIVAVITVWLSGGFH